MNKLFILLLLILLGCQLKEPKKNHGILFLENRANKLIVNQSNKNDVIKIIGQPHAKSINNEDIWIYLERTLSKGKYHKLGKHVLKTNNTLILDFNKYGVLASKRFLNKEDIKKIAFSKNSTKNELSQRSFITNFLSSVKEKMYSNRR
jgi:outer membrane protein assembly factor BamE (lipoprotein component of BamABCDE complex)